MPQITGP